VGDKDAGTSYAEEGGASVEYDGCVFWGGVAAAAAAADVNNRIKLCQKRCGRLSYDLHLGQYHG
jgi:hypothetical protein